MTAHHFFVDPADINADSLTLRGDDARHASRVLRVQTGEAITAADGTGRVIEATVRRTGDEVVAGITGERFVDAPRPAVTLVQAVPKGDKLETVVEKATEVGVSRIAPFIAQRTVAKWDARKLERVHGRLTAIARAAAKQSGAARLPVVDHVASSAMVGPGSFVLHEASATRLRDALPEDAPDALSIVVGPEGGFSDVEVAVMEADGATAVTLGPRILRTETAGPVAVAVIGYRYGWFG